MSDEQPAPESGSTIRASGSLEHLVRRYRDALEQIAALSGVTEVRGPLEDIGFPDHMVKDGGWVPIHPRLKDGLCYAAKIANTALLDDSPNAAGERPENNQRPEI